MPLVTTSVPNLTGGVSQQPAAQRLPNQCEAQENALPLLVGGLIKRPPSVHLSELKTFADASIDLSGAFTHFVTRDPTEEFLISMTGVGNTVHINDIDGTPKQVFADLGASTYLTTSTPQSSFRAITIADVTFLVNTDVAAQMKTDAADLSPFSRAQSAAPYEGLIWIRSTQQGISYTVRVKGDGEDEDFISTVFHTPAAQDIGGDGSSGDPNIYGYPPGSPSTTDIASGLAVGTVEGEAVGLTDCTVGASFISIYHDQIGSNPASLPTACTVEVTDTTIVFTITGGADAGSSPYTLTLADVGNDTLDELAAAINALDQGIVASVPNGGGSVSSTVLPVTAAQDCFGIDKIKFFVRPGGLNGYSDYSSSSSGSVVFVQNTDEDFQLTVEDSLGQNGHKVIKGSVQDFSDLPPIAKNGMIVEVKGDPESEVDDYFIKFETNGDEDFGEGIWIETVGPGIVYQWDYDTLPHILIRQADGTFMIKRADGVTPGSGIPAGADYSAFKFTPREVGSDLTNPKPSFVSRSLRIELRS